MLHLGGFAEAARVLEGMTGRHWTRQHVYKIWRFRHVNQFPDRSQYCIEGRIKLYFDMDEVASWQRAQEARQSM